MDISVEKINIIQKICEIQDTDLLDMIQNIIDNPKSSKSDWWSKLSKEEQASVDRGLSDLEKGKVHSHHQIRKRYEKYLKD
jgi:hypothetical protein